MWRKQPRTILLTELTNKSMRLEDHRNRNADFPVCRITDIPVGSGCEPSRLLKPSTIRRLESLRYVKFHAL